MKILILCTGNSCRSQMAQGLLQSFNKNIDVFSAGTVPASKVNAKAIKVMAEVGIDISNSIPKPVDKYIKDDWDYVITVCDNAREVCPAFSGKVKKQFHMGFNDPSDFQGNEEQIMDEFRRIRDEIKITFYRFYNDILK
jgi:arsenate reductase